MFRLAGREVATASRAFVSIARGAGVGATAATIALLGVVPVSAQRNLDRNPTLSELFEIGYVPVASGDLTTRWKQLPPMDFSMVAGKHWQGCSWADPDCDGRMDVRVGKFMRLVRADDAFVCINDGAVECHHVPASGPTASEKSDR